jgi:hypothetical protein
MIGSRHLGHARIPDARVLRQSGSKFRQLKLEGESRFFFQLNTSR